MAQYKSFTIIHVCEGEREGKGERDLQTKQNMFMRPCILFPNLVTDMLSYALSVWGRENDCVWMNVCVCVCLYAETF